MILSVLLGVLLAFIVIGFAVGTLWLVSRSAMRRVEESLGRSPKFTLWEFLFNPYRLRTLSLTMQRAEIGTPAMHPLGSTPAVSWLDQIGLDPQTLLVRSPLGKSVDLRVRLGPRAQKPLDLALPVIVAPMGYGMGLTLNAKIAIAQACTLAGTAVVSGEGPYLPEERAFAERWILQQSRASWGHQPAVAELADMIEIQLGQGAEAGIRIKKSRDQLPRRISSFVRGGVTIHAAPYRDPSRWFHELKTLRRDCPIGIKIPASQHIEADLAYLVGLGLDFITIDGSQAGSASSPAVVSDQFGITTELAVHRSHQWLTRNGYRPSLSLIASGGIRGAADIAKLLALGADCVAVGSTVLMVLSHEQVAPNLPGSPPTALVLAHGRHSQKHPATLDIDRASEHLANWFEATKAELNVIGQALGIQSIGELAPSHLIARTPEAAKIFSIAGDMRPAGWTPAVHNVDSLVAHYQHINRILSRISTLLSKKGGVGL